MLLKMLLLLLPVYIWWENTENQNSEIAANTSEAGTCNFILFKKRLWQWCFPVNFAKFLRAPFWQITSGWLLLKWNKTKGLSLLIAFSSLSDINTTLKIGITITWSFTLRYVIATSSWCWKKISYNDDHDMLISVWYNFIMLKKPSSTEFIFYGDASVKWKYQFDVLSKFAKLALVLPHWNALEERVFSMVKRKHNLEQA